MKIQWEEIYTNSGNKDVFAYYEATYRAKVFGGWLIRHETCNDYQYETTLEDIKEPSTEKYIHEEGWQNVRHVLTFIPDPKHEWTDE